MGAAPQTLAEEIAAALARHGVRRLFGIPGGGSSLALIDAADAAGIDFVLARTETAAALMAAVTGELTGTPGAVLTGIGPGAASAVNGVAYAHLERAPLLLLTDGPAASLHQAVDQTALFRPITKRQGRLAPAGGAAAIEDALRTALAPPRGPVQLDLTADDAASPVSDAGAPAPDTSKPTLDADALDTARRLLAGARRPVLLVGLEARAPQAAAALRRLAEALACPVLPSYKAKGVLPDTHPQTVGLFTGAAAEADAIARADLIVPVGFDPVEMIPGPWRYRAPILELRTAADPPWPVAPACTVVGPLAAIVDRLLPLDAETDWRADEIAGLRDALRARLALAGHGHTAQSVAEALNAGAPAGCRYAVDAGAHMIGVLAFLAVDRPFGVLKSNGLSTMGFAVPAAIASALAEPDRPVAAVTGDGGLMMCLSELATAVERALPVVTVVLNDAALSLIDIKQSRQQRKSLGVRTPRVDFAGVAEALGCRAWRVGPDQPLAPVLEAAFDGDGPALVDVAVDPSGYGDQLAALRG